MASKPLDKIYSKKFRQFYKHFGTKKEQQVIKNDRVIATGMSGFSISLYLREVFLFLQWM